MPMGVRCQPLYAIPRNKDGGTGGNRTRVRGFAVLYITTLTPRLNVIVSEVLLFRVPPPVKSIRRYKRAGNDVESAVEKESAF
jgi:hypothetical protein